MKYAIKVKWAEPDDWLYVCESFGVVATYDTKEEAEEFRSIWSEEYSEVVEYEEERF